MRLDQPNEFEVVYSAVRDQNVRQLKQNQCVYDILKLVAIDQHRHEGGLSVIYQNAINGIMRF